MSSNVTSDEYMSLRIISVVMSAERQTVTDTKEVTAPQPRETSIQVLLRAMGLPLGTRPPHPLKFSFSCFLHQLVLYF